MHRPLADEIRPKTLEEVVGQRHLLAPGGVLRRLIDAGTDANMVFYGPSGTGKTTVANIIAEKTHKTLYRLNATTASLQDVKDIIADVGTLLAPGGILLYLDEIQYFNKKQQQSLLEYMENGKITLVASTTENPYFYVYNALLSRSTVFEFKPLTAEETVPAVERALGIVQKQSVLPLSWEEEVPLTIATGCGGDVRKAVNAVELLSRAAKPVDGRLLLTKEDASQIAQHSAGLDRCQLVLVPQQHQARMGRQCIEQGRHHFQVHHGCLIDDEHIHIQRPPRMKAPVPRIRPRAQQRVQRARSAHALHQRLQIQSISHHLLQILERGFNRFLQPCCRLTRGRRQCHTQLLRLRRRSKQQRQQACCGIGLARAGAAGDDRKTPTQGHRTGHFLPVAASPRSHGKKAIQPLACGLLRQLHASGSTALQDVCGHHAFMVPVTAQIQQGVGAIYCSQHQGLGTVCLGGCTHQWTCLQCLQPLRTCTRQALPQSQQMGQVFRIPAQHRIGRSHQISQRQAAVTAPFHLCQHGCRH